METSFNRGVSFTLAALILGGSLIAATVIASGVAYRVKSLGNTISVTGSAEKTITSDVAKWTGSFSRTVDANGLKAGYAQMTADLNVIKSLLKEKGVSDDQISVLPVTVNENTECMQVTSSGICQGTRLIGYTLSEMLVVEANDVDKVTKLAQDAPSSLADKGIVFQGQSPEYYYSKLADLKLDMLTEATKSAKDRADKIVGSTGAKLGNLQSAGMGVFQITTVNSTEISDYGTYDTTSIQKKVTAIVRASFLLE